jgi:hypothetical protein
MPEPETIPHGVQSSSPEYDGLVAVDMAKGFEHHGAGAEPVMDESHSTAAAM